MKNKIIMIGAFAIYFSSIAFICFSFSKTTTESTTTSNPKQNNVVFNEELNSFKLGEKTKIDTKLDLGLLFNESNTKDSLTHTKTDFIINHDKIYFRANFMECDFKTRSVDFSNSNTNYIDLCKKLKELDKTTHTQKKYKDYRDYNSVLGVVEDIKGENYTILDEVAGSANYTSFVYQDKKNVYYYGNGMYRIDKTTNEKNEFVGGTIVGKPLSNDEQLFVVTSKGYKDELVNYVDNNTYKTIKTEKYYNEPNYIRLDVQNNKDFYTIYEKGIYKNNSQLLVEKFDEDNYSFILNLLVDEKNLYIFTYKYNFEGDNYKNGMVNTKVKVYDKNTGEFVKEKDYDLIRKSLFDTYLTTKEGIIYVSKFESDKESYNSSGTYKILRLNPDTLDFETVNEKKMDTSVFESTNFKNKFEYFTHNYVINYEKDISVEEYMKLSAKQDLFILEIYDYNKDEFISIPNVYYYYFNELENRLYTVESDENNKLDLYYYSLYE